MPQAVEPFHASYPVGGLATHENAGGHLLALHVGHTDAQLAARLSSQPRISGASTFTSRAVAVNAVSGALDANEGAIQTWLRGTAEKGKGVEKGSRKGVRPCILTLMVLCKFL